MMRNDALAADTDKRTAANAVSSGAKVKEIDAADTPTVVAMISAETASGDDGSAFETNLSPPPLVVISGEKPQKGSRFITTKDSSAYDEDSVLYLSVCPTHYVFMGEGGANAVFKIKDRPSSLSLSSSPLPPNQSCEAPLPLPPSQLASPLSCDAMSCECLHPLDAMAAHLVKRRIKKRKDALRRGRDSADGDGGGNNRANSDSGSGVDDDSFDNDDAKEIALLAATRRLLSDLLPGALVLRVCKRPMLLDGGGGGGGGGDIPTRPPNGPLSCSPAPLSVSAKVLSSAKASTMHDASATQKRGEGGGESSGGTAFSPLVTSDLIAITSDTNENSPADDVGNGDNKKEGEGERGEAAFFISPRDPFLSSPPPQEGIDTACIAGNNAADMPSPQRVGPFAAAAEEGKSAEEGPPLPSSSPFPSLSISPPSDDRILNSLHASLRSGATFSSSVKDPIVHAALRPYIGLVLGEDGNGNEDDADDDKGRRGTDREFSSLSLSSPTSMQALQKALQRAIRTVIVNICLDDFKGIIADGDVGGDDSGRRRVGEGGTPWNEVAPLFFPPCSPSYSPSSPSAAASSASVLRCSKVRRGVVDDNNAMSAPLVASCWPHHTPSTPFPSPFSPSFSSSHHTAVIQPNFCAPITALLNISNAAQRKQQRLSSPSAYCADDVSSVDNTNSANADPSNANAEMRANPSSSPTPSPPPPFERHVALEVKPKRLWLPPAVAVRVALEKALSATNTSTNASSVTFGNLPSDDGDGNGFVFDADTIVKALHPAKHGQCRYSMMLQHKKKKKKEKKAHMDVNETNKLGEEARANAENEGKQPSVKKATKKKGILDVEKHRWHLLPPSSSSFASFTKLDAARQEAISGGDSSSASPTAALPDPSSLLSYHCASSENVLHSILSQSVFGCFKLWQQKNDGREKKDGDAVSSSVPSPSAVTVPSLPKFGATYCPSMLLRLEKKKGRDVPMLGDAPPSFGGEACPHCRRGGHGGSGGEKKEDEEGEEERKRDASPALEAFTALFQQPSNNLSVVEGGDGFYLAGFTSPSSSSPTLSPPSLQEGASPSPSPPFTPYPPPFQPSTLLLSFLDVVFSTDATHVCGRIGQLQAEGLDVEALTTIMSAIAQKQQEEQEGRQEEGEAQVNRSSLPAQRLDALRQRFEDLFYAAVTASDVSIMVSVTDLSSSSPTNKADDDDPLRSCAAVKHDDIRRAAAESRRGLGEAEETEEVVLRVQRTLPSMSLSSPPSLPDQAPPPTRGARAVTWVLTAIPTCAIGVVVLAQCFDGGDEEEGVRTCIASYAATVSVIDIDSKRAYKPISYYKQQDEAILSALL